MINEMMTVITVACIVLAVLAAVLLVVVVARCYNRHRANKLKAILAKYNTSDREALMITTEMFYHGKLKISIKDTEVIDMLSGKA